MDKRKTSLILGIGIAIVLLIVLGVSFAYFAARIINNESTSTVVAKSGIMTIIYSEDSNLINIHDIYPRDEEWATKVITLKGTNTTSLDMTYEIGFNITNNTFKGGQLSFSLTGEGDNGTLIENIENKPIARQSGYMQIGVGTFNTVKDKTHTYTLKLYFKETGNDQNFNQEAVFNAKLNVKDRGAELIAYQELMKSRVNTTNQNHTEKYCQTDDYVEGSTPTNNQVYEPINSIYNYTYSDGGWKVSLKDATSTAAITEGPCTYVNNKVVNSMYGLFKDSKAASIDLTNFNTSHVIGMYDMFSNSAATTIIGLDSFDTSNVIDMARMFFSVKVTVLDLSSFDTSKVTNMTWMFRNTEAESLNLSNFDTSNVTNMSYMFYQSNAETLDLSSFDTSNVTNMDNMFYQSNAETLDLSSFDTSKVTNMNYMFSSCAATNLELSSFDTSKVKDMTWMFRNSKAITLNLSNFDTSNVTNMSNMFFNCEATNIELSSFDTSKVTNMNYMFFSNKVKNLNLITFDTSNVTNMSYMFYNAAVRTLDLSSFDTSKVTNMNYIFNLSKATAGYAKTQADADRFNNVAGSLSNGENPNSGIPNTLRFTVK